jgi:hypothetical protein
MSNRRNFLSPLLSLMLLGGTTLRANTIISVQFQGINNVPVNFSGVEPDAASADANFANSNHWNHLNGDCCISWSHLVDSTGADSGASFSSAPFPYAGDAYNAGSDNLPDTYIWAPAVGGSSHIFGIAGLAPNQSFTLFIYAFNSANSTNDRGAIYTVGSSIFNTSTGHHSSEDATHAVDGLITGVTSSTGTISGTWAFDTQNHSEMDWSGFQLDVASAAASAPEPATFALFAGSCALLFLRQALKSFRPSVSRPRPFGFPK